MTTPTTTTYKCLCEDSHHKGESHVTVEVNVLRHTITTYTCRVKGCPAFGVTLTASDHERVWTADGYASYKAVQR